MPSQYDEFVKKLIGEMDAATRAFAVSVIKENSSGITFLESADKIGAAVRFTLPPKNKTKYALKDLYASIDILVAGEKQCVEIYTDKKSILLCARCDENLVRGLSVEIKQKNLKKAHKRFCKIVERLFAETGINPERSQY